jgi:hypothetical protein
MSIIPVDPARVARCNGTAIGANGQFWYDEFVGIPLDDCYNLYRDIIYTTPPDTLAFNPAGLAYVQSQMQLIFTKYLASHSIVAPGQLGYNTFQETLLSVCRRLPGACDTSVPNLICPTGPADTVRSTIAANPQLLSFCGCYAPAPSDPNLNVAGPCDPLCSRIDTIPILDVAANNGLAKNCNQDVCVIDDVNITSINSTNPNGVNFTQLCNNCGTGSCKCIIKLPNINQTLNSIGIDSNNFGQFCGASSVCYLEDSNNPNAPSTPVPCQSSTTITATNHYSSTPSLLFWIVLIVVVILFVLVFTAIAVGKRQRTRLSE